MSDYVVQLACDACALLGHGGAGTFLAFTLGSEGPPVGLVGFLELAPEHEADRPEDREDEADEDELSDLAPRVVVDDDGLDTDRERQPDERTRPVTQLSDQEERRGTGEERWEVVLRERVVDEPGSSRRMTTPARCCG